MAKLKIRRNSVGYEVTVKLQNQELINENEMAFFANRLTRGFVNPVVVNSRKLRYDVPGSETLLMFLRSGIRIEDVFNIIVQFLEVIKKMEAMKLYLCNVILDLNCVFYKVSTRELQFIYQPLINTNFRINLFDFLNYVICNSVLRPGEDNSMIGRFYQLLSSMERLDIKTLLDFIMNNVPYAFGNTQGQRISGILFGKKETQPNSKSHNDNHVSYSQKEYQGQSVPNLGYTKRENIIEKQKPSIENNVLFEDKSKKALEQQTQNEDKFGNISGNLINSQQKIDEKSDNMSEQHNNDEFPVNTEENPYKDKEISAVNSYRKDLHNNEESVDNSDLQYDSNDYGVAGTGDTVLLDDDEGTVLLDDYGGTILLNESITIATLTRKKTGEKTIIDKNIFRVGTNKNLVDYVVTDNRAVSRTHADIITKGDKFYIYDEKSTNGTYVNDICVEKKKEFEIHSGDTIRLADEEFIFEIE